MSRLGACRDPGLAAAGARRRRPPVSKWVLLVLLALASVAPAGLAAQAEDEIRAARAAFNLAIAEGRAEAIPRFLAPEYHLVTSRNAQVHGIDANRRLWAEVFAADPDEVYVRTPRRVRVMDDWGVAEELGDWEGRRVQEGSAVELAGTYAARWVRVEGVWLLLSEVFTASSCRGTSEACGPP